MAEPQKFRSRHRDTCRICRGQRLFRYLDLGRQPPSNSFISAADIPREQRFPLDVYLCEDCGLSQLGELVYSEDIFDEYAYLSSTSKALCRHYQGMIDASVAAFHPPEGALVVDIGCNDGITLACYPKGRFRVLGVEPSSAGDYARRAGFEVVSEFFGADVGARLAAIHGPAKIITATNVFAHVDDIRDFTAGIRALLAGDGVYIIEFPYLVDMIERCYFDTIYHEHLSYLALTPLHRMFGELGLRAFRVERTEIGASGPALRLFVARQEAPHRPDGSFERMLSDEASWGVTRRHAYERFAGRVLKVQTEIRRIVQSLIASGGRIGAYGAPAKGNTLLNCLDLTPKEIVAVAENNALKVGKVTPGAHIPIVDDAAFLGLGITHALLLTWNYLDFFLTNSEFVKRGGKFIVPLPEPTIRP